VVHGQVHGLVHGVVGGVVRGVVHSVVDKTYLLLLKVHILPYLSPGCPVGISILPLALPGIHYLYQSYF